VKTTNNYGLKKPDKEDFYNVADQNENTDVIDAKLKELEETDSDINTSLSTHTKDTGNPHGVTKSQVGLGNVPNVSTNDQTPTYSVASSITALSSGEKLSVAFGKISKAINSLISHLSDTVGHITSAERTAWNAKVDSSGTVANADTLDGYHASSFVIRDSAGNFSFVPTFTGGVGGSEGGEVHFKKPPSNTDFTGDITLDVVTNTVRIFAVYSNETRLFVIDFAELKAGENEALHTGNSAKVIISDTAPTDTKALWIS